MEISRPVVQKSLPRFAIGVEKEHFKTIDGEERVLRVVGGGYLVGVDVTSIGADVDGFGGLPEEERDRLLGNDCEETVGGIGQAIDVGWVCAGCHVKRR